MIVKNLNKCIRTLNCKPKFNNLKFILKAAYEWEKNFNLQ